MVTGMLFVMFSAPAIACEKGSPERGALFTIAGVLAFVFGGWADIYFFLS